MNPRWVPVSNATLDKDTLTKAPANAWLTISKSMVLCAGMVIMYLVVYDWVHMCTLPYTTYVQSAVYYHVCTFSQILTPTIFT